MLVIQSCLVQIGHGRSTQQLIAADRALHLVLILEVALQNRLGTHLPVRRAGAHRAPAVGAVHVALNLFAGQIHARSHLLLRAEEPPHIYRAVRRPAMVGRQIRGFDHRRPLGHVVDQSARRGHAALHAGNAFQELHPLLVFQRHILLAGDGHAVDLKPRGQIDGEAANLVVAVVPDRRVILANGGIVLDHVGEHARPLVGEQLTGHHGGRERRLLQRCAVQRANRDSIGKILLCFAAHDHRRYHAWNRLRGRSGLLGGSR